MNIPAIGRIVHYNLLQKDADAINARREHAQNHLTEHIHNKSGVVLHWGSLVYSDRLYPLLITSINFDTGNISGVVFADGSDPYYVKDVLEGTERGTYSWPVFK